MKPSLTTILVAINLHAGRGDYETHGEHHTPRFQDCDVPRCKEAMNTLAAVLKKNG
jgi:hypothetical protein